VANAALPIPINSNMYPTSFNVNPPWYTTLFLTAGSEKYKVSRPNLGLSD
jgi:hypothetical protein